MKKYFAFFILGGLISFCFQNAWAADSVEKELANTKNMLRQSFEKNKELTEQNKAYETKVMKLLEKVSSQDKEYQPLSEKLAFSLDELKKEKEERKKIELSNQELTAKVTSLESEIKHAAESPEMIQKDAYIEELKTLLEKVKVVEKKSDEEVVSLKEKLKSTQQSLENSENELRSKNQKMGELETKLQEMDATSELGKQQEEIIRLQSEVAAHAAEKRHFKDMESNFQNKLNELEIQMKKNDKTTELQTLEQERIQLKTQQETTLKENVGLRAKIASLEKESVQSQKDLSDQEGLVAKKTEEAKALETSIESLKEEIKTKESTIQSAAKKEVSLNQQITDLKKQLADDTVQKQSQAAYEKMVTEFKKQLEISEGNLRKAHADLQAQKNVAFGKQEELNVLQAQMKTKEMTAAQEISKLKKLSGFHEKNFDETKTLLNKTQKRLTDIESLYAETQTQAVIMEAKIRDYERMRQHMEKEAASSRKTQQSIEENPLKEIKKYQKKIEKLESKLRQVQENHEEDQANYYFNLGAAFIKQGSYNEAVKVYEKAIMINPKDATTHYNLGILYEDYLDNPQKALRHYEAFLAVGNDKQKLMEVDRWVKKIKGIGDGIEGRKSRFQSSVEAVDHLFLTNSR